MTKAKPEKKARTPKINKYGFLHIDKDLAKHLGVEFGKDKEDVPVAIECIDDGFTVHVVGRPSRSQSPAPERAHTRSI